MRIIEHWEKDYQASTKELSEISRKLAFAAGAICWFFKSPDITFPTLISITLLFLVLYFTFDICQYFMAMRNSRKWLKDEEERILENKEGKISEKVGFLDPNSIVQKPERIVRLPFFFLNLKIVCLFLCYLALMAEFVKRLIIKIL